MKSVFEIHSEELVHSSKLYEISVKRNTKVETSMFCELVKILNEKRTTRKFSYSERVLTISILGFFLILIFLFLLLFLLLRCFIVAGFIIGWRWFLGGGCFGFFGRFSVLLPFLLLFLFDFV